MNQKKKNQIFLIVLLLILISLIYCTIRFEISKIINYSSAEAIDNSETLQDFDISQYSDFAIFIDNHSKIEELTE